ncbi:MAG: sugar phosphate isomerase/epimerase family protein [Pirellulales bacterium]
MHRDISIGTLVKAEQNAADYIRQILPHGFESFQLVFRRHLHDADLPLLARQVRQVLDESGHAATVSALGLYGNPLTDDGTAHDFGRLIDAAGEFGTNLVCGFAGRLPNRPIPESLPRFGQVFGPLARRAEDCGVRIAFENCDMGGTWDYGDWNIAHAPAAWERMFNEVPSPALGLEWEPCHQMVSLADPLPQLRQWAAKVFHVHGKDATVLWDIVKSRGIRGGETYVYHRTPGFGDTNWADVFSTLRMAGYRGAIDIEGWHDPVYRDELEMTGQVHALEYLQRCRGGRYIPNPA